MDVGTSVTPSGLPVTAVALLTGARRARGLSTLDVAQQVHATRRYVQMVEAGDRVPAATMLELWARVIGLDADGERALLHALRDAVR